MVIRRFSPFEELEAVRDQINQIFEPMVRSVNEELRSAAWSIPIELMENASLYKIRAYLPGIDPEKLDVQVTGRTLTMTAEIQPPEVEKGEYVHMKEFRYGKFKRTIEFGQPIVSGNVQANYQQGILTLEVPKEEAAQQKSVKVEIKN